MKKLYSLFTAVVCAVSFTAQAQTVVTETLLVEDFKTVKGTGGSDGTFKGSVAGSELTKYGDWKLVKAYSAHESLKLGTGSIQGILQTPEIVVPTFDTDKYELIDYVLTFKAGAWDNSKENSNLLLEIDNNSTLEVQSVKMQVGKYSDFTVKISNLEPNSRISFKGEKATNSRFFIDDIVVVRNLKEKSLPTPTPTIEFDMPDVVFEKTDLDKTSELPLTVKSSSEIEFFIDGTDADMFRVVKSADEASRTAKSTNTDLITTTLLITFEPTSTGNKTAQLIVSMGDISKSIELVGEAYDSSLSTIDFNDAKASLVKNTFIKDELVFGQNTEVTIVNMNGQIVKSAKVSEGTVMNVSSLAKGMYIVTGSVNGKAVSQKVIKK